MAYIFSDPNVRDAFVTESDDILIYDTSVVVQSVWRLLNTEIGEIPNFRNYGLDIKRFCQYPLTNDTINDIYNYVKDRVESFEDRAEVARADVDVDFDRGLVYFVFWIRVKATQEAVKLPTWVIQVSTI